MDEIVKSVLAFLEYLILGAMALSSIAVMLFALFGKRSWREHLAEISTFFQKDKPGLSQAFVLSLIGAFMYFVGIIVNTIAYDFVQPAHIHIVAAVEASNLVDDPDPSPDVWVYFSTIPLPRFRKVSPKEYALYHRNSRRDLEWLKQESHSKDQDTTGQASKDKNLHDRVLEMLNRQSKLARGSLLITSFWGVICLPILIRKHSWKWRPILFAYICCGFLYYILMNAFWGLEMDYHKAVCFMMPILPSP